MTNENNCRHPLTRLPWNEILKEINENYYEIIEKKFGNGQNDELKELLTSTKFNAVMLNDAPYGKPPKIKYEDNFFGDAAKELNENLDVILERYKVPKKLRENMVLSSFHVNTFTANQTTSPCRLEWIDICGNGNFDQYWCCY